MKFKLISFVKSYWSKILPVLFFVLLLGAYANIFAIGSPYSPGSTLDPECAPGETNCTVLLTSTQWQDDDNDIYFTNGNVGIGTNNPSSILHIKTDDPQNELSSYEIDESIASSSTFAISGTAKTWRSDDMAYSYTLPFSFPYFGEGITDIQVSTNGYLLMCASCGSDDYYDGDIDIPNQNVIAPLMGDLRTDQTDQDIFVDETIANEVTIIWKGQVYGGGPVNFSVTLKSNGQIIFKYGEGNSSFANPEDGVIAVSDGFGVKYFISSLSGSSSKNNANDITINITEISGVAPTSLMSLNTISSDLFTVLDNGRVGIGNSLPDYSAILDISSTSKGVLVPRMTSVQKQAIRSPETSLLVYQTDSTPGFQYYSGSEWTNLKETNVVNVSTTTGSIYSTLLGSPSISNSNFLGNLAGSSASNAYNSNFLGSQAGSGSTFANDSSFIGYGAGQTAVNANKSNFIGSSAGASATNAYGSNFFGFFAGQTASNAHESNFLGYQAGYQASNAYGSNFLGPFAGYGATNASNSIFIGLNAGNSDTVNNTTNPDNWSILLGHRTRTGGFSNSVLIGGSNSVSYISNTKANQFMLAPTLTELRLRGVDYTLPSSQGGASTVLTNNGSGVLTWASASGGLTSNADFNTLGGTNAGLNLVSGAQYNTFLGYEAGKSATSGGTNAADRNTAIGYSSLWSNTTGSQNVALGMQSLYNNTTGVDNTSLGADSSRFNTTGSKNTANGSGSLWSNVDGNENTVDGYRSLFSNSSGSYNVALGSSAGRFISGGVTNNTTGDYNIFLGSNTKALADNDQNEIVIGYNTTGNGSNTTTIGTGNVLYVGGASITGKVARFTNTAGYCDIDPLNVALTCSSDISLKKNITTLEQTPDGEQVKFELNKEIELPSTTLEKILTLTPVTYNWNTEEYEVDENGKDNKHIGFIAQEMEQLFPDLVFTDKDRINPLTGEGLKSIAYSNLIPYTIKALQEMNLKVEGINEFELDKDGNTIVNSFRDSIVAWLGNVENGIKSVFFGEVHTDQLCLEGSEGEDSLCITKEQLQQLLDNANTEPASSTVVPANTSATTATATSTTPQTSTTTTTPASSTPATPSGTATPVDGTVASGTEGSTGVGSSATESQSGTEGSGNTDGADGSTSGE